MFVNNIVLSTISAPAKAGPSLAAARTLGWGLNVWVTPRTPDGRGLASTAAVDGQHRDLQVGMTSSIGGVGRQSAEGGRQPSEVLPKTAGICWPGRY